MDSRSKNRLFPSANLHTAATTSTRPLLNAHPIRVAAPRRRCRSECLPITSTLVGVPIDARMYDELSYQKHQRPLLPQQTPVVNIRTVNQKYASSSVLRNQDSVKNIFSCSALNVARPQPRSQGLYRKENISTKQMDPAAGGCGIVSQSQSRMAEFERIDDYQFTLQKSPWKFGPGDVDQASRSRRPSQRVCPNAEYTRGIFFVDGQKRRVRSLSETDPEHMHFVQRTRQQNQTAYQSGDATLKRTRGNRSNSSQPHSNNQSNNQQQHSRIHGPTIEANNDSDSSSIRFPNTSPRGPSKLPVNPKYTKIVAHHLGKPSSGRISSKVLRKTRSRATNEGGSMGLSTNTLPDVVAGGPAGSPEKPLAPKNGHVEDDSDTGCSSLDDDDDFDDVVEDDFVDSLSDLDDASSGHLSSFSLSVDGKQSDASMCTADCVVGRFVSSAPLSASLFPNVPPYISFATHSEKGPRMPETVHRVLKWKLTAITPIVIRKVLLNTGFRLLRNEDFPIRADTDNDLLSSDEDDTNDWMGVWGKHMKSPCFKTLRSYQKINHIPGTFQIGRKDRVWRNLQTLIARHGKKDFGFMPSTFIIPADLKQLRRQWPNYSQRNAKWIIKPPASARGTGIKVVSRWNQIPKRKPLVVQRYIERPLLINGSKFDLRLYVLITSINPLRVFMHTDGLARFASVKYSEKTETLHDRYMHLTNYSINKHSSNYSKNEDANACQGHKWTIKSLWTHLAAQGVNTSGLWGALRNLVLRTILAGENPINNMTKANLNSRYNCFELFGIDVLLDSELKPWLLEVNISPSLHSASPLDLYVKGPLCTALLNTALFQVPPRIPIDLQQQIMSDQGLKGNLCYDKRLFVNTATKTERFKHLEFTTKSREQYLTNILRNLTPEDVRTIMIAEDELARSAPLERIFPTPTSHRYHKFIEGPRYLNQLLDAWEHTYGTSPKAREEGLILLRRFAADGVHLIVPAEPVKKVYESSEAPRPAPERSSDQSGSEIQPTSPRSAGDEGDAPSSSRGSDEHEPSSTITTPRSAKSTVRSSRRNHDRGDIQQDDLDAATLPPLCARLSSTLMVERVSNNLLATAAAAAPVHKCS